MQTIHFFYQRPSVYPQVSTDDFGDEVMAVSSISRDVTMFQVQVSKDTFDHVYDLYWKVLDWKRGYREE